MTMSSREDGIPGDWPYIWSPKWSNLFRRLPAGWIVEGTCTAQCLCPYCAYGKGYNQPFNTASVNEKEVTCETCETTFVALVP